MTPVCVTAGVLSERLAVPIALWSPKSKTLPSRLSGGGNIVGSYGKTEGICA